MPCNQMKCKPWEGGDRQSIPVSLGPVRRVSVHWMIGKRENHTLIAFCQYTTPHFLSHKVRGMRMRQSAFSLWSSQTCKLPWGGRRETLWWGSERSSLRRAQPLCAVTSGRSLNLFFSVVYKAGVLHLPFLFYTLGEGSNEIKNTQVLWKLESKACFPAQPDSSSRKHRLDPSLQRKPAGSQLIQCFSKLFLASEWVVSKQLWDPMDYSIPGSSVHGISQARILEWVAFPSPGDHPDPGVEHGSPELQELLYIVVLVSARHQHESAIGTHMSPPSWTSVPPSIPVLFCFLILRYLRSFPENSHYWQL